MSEVDQSLAGKNDASLFTDFYELTMCASYYACKRNEKVNFDLFIRRFPSNRSYFIFAGLERVLKYLEGLHFDDSQIVYLSQQGFSADFLRYLKDFRFTGEVWAMPEGSVVFPEEPLIRVTAPMIEAQIAETFLLNAVNVQTMLATKASGVVFAAREKPVVEFGLRRSQGTDAGMEATRCSYLAGCSGTSNVLAAMKYAIPVFGTMAHSYVMFFSSETEAFQAFAQAFPGNAVFLIDTYDSLAGAKNAASVATEARKQGIRISGVRLDSGDLNGLSRKVRSILDEHGLQDVQIFASGDLDEYKIEKLLRDGARIDSFGVGTRMSTSSDRPYVDVVYKLSAKLENGEFVPVMKLSRGKATLPGIKQVFRFCDGKRRYVKDVVALTDEQIQGEPMLTRVMKEGKTTHDSPKLPDIRELVRDNMLKLPDRYKRLRKAPRYPVRLSPKLLSIRKLLEAKLKD